MKTNQNNQVDVGNEVVRTINNYLFLRKIKDVLNSFSNINSTIFNDQNLKCLLITINTTIWIDDKCPAHLEHFGAETTIWSTFVPPLCLTMRQEHSVSWKPGHLCFPVLP